MVKETLKLKHELPMDTRRLEPNLKYVKLSIGQYTKRLC